MGAPPVTTPPLASWIMPSILFLALALTGPARAGDPAHPVAGDTAGLGRYLTEEPDPRVFAVPDTVLERVRSDPSGAVPELVSFLVEGTDDPFLQVKRLHDWVAVNLRYDLEGLLQPDRAPAGGAYGALTSGRAVCSGFAGVQELLLETAGFEAHTITGYARGSGFSTLVDEQVDRSNHAWTAVEIEGAWYLMDTTWNAGNRLEGRWRHDYTTDDLFLDPAQFVTTHLPLDPAWQLLEAPIEAGAFQAQAFTTSGFHRQGLAFVGEAPRLQQVGAEATVRLSVPAGLWLTCELEAADGTRIPGATLQLWDGDELTIRVRFPAPGPHQLLIFTAPLDQQNTWRVAELGFMASEGADDSFPTAYRPYEADRASLVTPWSLPDEAGTVRIVVRVQGARAVAVDTPGARWQQLQPRKRGLWVGRVVIDPDEPVVLLARRGAGGQSWDHLLRWPGDED